MLFLKKQKNTIYVFVLFFIISFFLIHSFLFSHNIFAQGDFLFHWNRINFLKDSVLNGEINYRAFNYLSSIGSAVNFFYPFVFLFPFAFLQIAVSSPITAFYIAMFLFMFATFIVAYFSMFSFSKSKMSSVFFALMYGTSNYYLYISFDQFVLGEFLAYTFLPLAFLGFYEVFFDNFKKWKILSIGVTLIFYSHILSFVLSVSIMTGICIVFLFFGKISNLKSRIIATLKSISLFLLLTTFIWVPFIYEFLQTKIQTTISQPVLFERTIQENIGSIFRQIAPNFENANVGMAILFLIFIFWALKKNLQITTMYLIGILILFISTANFPWKSVPFKIQSLIQFPYRLTSFAILFIVAAVSIQIGKIKIPNNKSFFFIVVPFLFLTLINWQISTDRIISTRLKEQTYPSKIRMEKPTNEFLEWKFNLDKEHAKNFFNIRHDYVGVVDYAPVDAWKPENRSTILAQDVLSRKMTVKNKEDKKIDFSSYLFNTRNIKNKIDLPFLNYGNETVFLNGKKTVYFRTERGTIGVETKKGKNLVKITYPTPIWIYSLWIQAVITWLILVGIFLRKNAKK